MNHLWKPRRAVAFAALLLAPLLGGCTSVPSPAAVLEDRELLSRLVPRGIKERVLIAPLKVEYEVHDFAGGRPREAGFRPQLSGEQTRQMGESIRQALAYVAREPVETLALEQAAPPSAAEVSADWLQAAEDRGAQLLITGSLVENRISFLGSSSGGQLLDFFILVMAPPFHWWVEDEGFLVERRLELSVWDVRDGSRPVYTTTVTGRDERFLNEFQHGIVLLNPVRATLGDGGPDRFEAYQWKGVYEGLAPHADRALLGNLLQTVSNELRPLLALPRVRERIERGDPSTARFYALVIGQNKGSASCAEADAKRVASVLRRRGGVRPGHLVTLLGDVTPSRIKEAVTSLRTKAVDRVLIYFAGQGFQDAGGQSLVLSGEGRLPVAELAAAARESLAAEQVLFVLDTSFGGGERGRRRGSRTAPGSLASLPDGGAAGYLAPLQDRERGWRVMCPARHDEVTGEYKGSGLFTGLLLEALEDGEDGLGARAALAQINARFRRRALVLLGGAHNVFCAPDRGMPDLTLVSRSASGATPGDETPRPSSETPEAPEATPSSGADTDRSDSTKTGQ